MLSLFQQGSTPEDIHQAFPSVDLAEIYAVIAFYLQNRSSVEAYLASVENAENAARGEMRARFPLTDLRERMLKHRDPVSA